MAKAMCMRFAVLTATFALSFGIAGIPARAALDVNVGARSVVKSGPLGDCDSKASRALISVLGKSAEVGDTHQWVALGAVDTAGSSFAAAAVQCYPLDGGGYVVTFTCAAQTPPAPETANVICSQLADKFGGQP